MKRFFLAVALSLGLASAASAQTAADLASFNDLISRLPAAQQTSLTKTRNAYNAALPLQYDAKGMAVTPTPGTLNDNASYWFFVFTMASKSYAVQYP